MKHSFPKQARKRFGQNFLHDLGVIDHIIRTINPKADDTIIEIGPGRGALTLPLLSSVNELHVVELDRDLIKPLADQAANLGKLTIYCADALNFDFSQITSSGGLRIIGNLPYNISTPLMFYLFEQKHLIKDMHFMLQKEVVNRMVAQPGSKSYGRLSIMTQIQCDASLIFEVAAESFIPTPKVDSAIISLRPLATPLIATEDVPAVNHLVTTAFSQRRKTIRNSLKSLLGEATLEQAGLSPNLRAEQLSINDFIALAKLLQQSEPKQT